MREIFDNMDFVPGRPRTYEDLSIAPRTSTPSPDDLGRQGERRTPFPVGMVSEASYEVLGRQKQNLKKEGGRGHPRS